MTFAEVAHYTALEKILPAPEQALLNRFVIAESTLKEGGG